MNKTILRGKWHRLQGNLKSEWGRLTHNDRRTLDGKIDQMVGLLQERYGYTQERAAQAVTHYLGKYGANQAPPPPVRIKSWLPVATFTVLLGLVTLGWCVMNQLLQATDDFADDNAIEAALEASLFDAEAK